MTGTEQVDGQPLDERCDDGHRGGRAVGTASGAARPRHHVPQPAEARGTRGIRRRRTRIAVDGPGPGGRAAPRHPARRPWHGWRWRRPPPPRPAARRGGRRRARCGRRRRSSHPAWRRTRSVKLRNAAKSGSVSMRSGGASVARRPAPGDERGGRQRAEHQAGEREVEHLRRPAAAPAVRTTPRPPARPVQASARFTARRSAPSADVARSRCAPTGPTTARPADRRQLAVGRCRARPTWARAWSRGPRRGRRRPARAPACRGRPAPASATMTARRPPAHGPPRRRRRRRAGRRQRFEHRDQQQRRR